MLSDAASVAFLLKALGYGVPAAIITLSFLVLRVLITYQREKTDKDRREHMIKWETMVQTHDSATKALITAHQCEINRLIDQHTHGTQTLIANHKEETARMFAMHERQALTLEAMAENLSAIAHVINKHQS